MHVKVISPQRVDARRLIQQADAAMMASYPAQSNHLDDADKLSSPNVYFLGGFADLRLAAIGAVKVLDDDGCYGEIKRIYVDPPYRGQGLASEIMRSLEQYLISNDVHLARLETGNRQTEAIALYKKMGYCTRQPYGKYVCDPLSVFMEKRLIRLSHQVGRLN